MKKALEFLNKYGILIIICLMLCVMVKTCSTNKKVKRFDKRQTEQVEQINERIDSIRKYQITDTDLRIEGLKSEKRMIQSTDRKRFDLEREKQIDAELKTLEEQKRK